MRSGETPLGLRYAVKRAGNAAAYCSLHIRCGTRCETGFNGGIAHFLEHTLFKGSRKRTARSISSRLDRLGGELNAYTTKEEIVLHATVLKEDIDKALDLILELATEATFPDAEIETERGVVIDEIISYKDNPPEDIYDTFDEMLFKGHPLGGRILGTRKSVSRISPEELRRFYRTFFVPENMALTMVADLEEGTMERKLKRVLSSRACEAGERIPSPASPVQTQVFHESRNRRNHEVNAILGGPAPSLYDGKDRITAAVLMNLLGGPASNSILGGILREKNGWVYNVECNYTQYSDTGLFTIAFGCDKPNLQKCLDCISRELSKLREKPLSEAKMKAARKQLLGQLAISSDNGEAQCLSMGKSLQSFGRVFSFEENKAAVEAVTAEDIQKMSLRLFDEGTLSTLVFY
jgi:predicted Zn-dependent peptidase